VLEQAWKHLDEFTARFCRPAAGGLPVLRGKAVEVQFIQARILGCGGHGECQCNALRRFTMSPQRPARDAIDAHGMSVHIAAQPARLLMPQRAEPIIIVGSERRLPMTDENDFAFVQGSGRLIGVGLQLRPRDLPPVYRIRPVSQP